MPLANGPVTEAQKKLNYTNVHVHGLQVNPGKNPDGTRSDNVYEYATPGNVLDYKYFIPGPETGRPQPGGMFWYHPHKHGTTSHQGWQGLAGPIIVEGPIDDVPEIAVARDRVMVLSEIMVNDQGETPTALIVPTVGEVPFTSRKSMPMEIMFPLNGVIAPEIDIQGSFAGGGEILR